MKTSENATPQFKIHRTSTKKTQEGPKLLKKASLMTTQAQKTNTAFYKFYLFTTTLLVKCSLQAVYPNPRAVEISTVTSTSDITVNITSQFIFQFATNISNIYFSVANDTYGADVRWQFATTSLDWTLPNFTDMHFFNTYDYESFFVTGFYNNKILVADAAIPEDLSDENVLELPIEPGAWGTLRFGKLWGIMNKTTNCTSNYPYMSFIRAQNSSYNKKTTGGSDPHTRLLVAPNNSLEAKKEQKSGVSVSPYMMEIKVFLHKQTLNFWLPWASNSSRYEVSGRVLDEAGGVEIFAFMKTQMNPNYYYSPSMTIVYYRAWRGGKNQSVEVPLFSENELASVAFVYRVFCFYRGDSDFYCIVHYSKKGAADNYYTLKKWIRSGLDGFFGDGEASSEAVLKKNEKFEKNNFMKNFGDLGENEVDDGRIGAKSGRKWSGEVQNVVKTPKKGQKQSPNFSQFQNLFNYNLTSFGFLFYWRDPYASFKNKNISVFIQYNSSNETITYCKFKVPAFNLEDYSTYKKSLCTQRYIGYTPPDNLFYDEILSQEDFVIVILRQGEGKNPNENTFIRFMYYFGKDMMLPEAVDFSIDKGFYGLIKGKGILSLETPDNFVEPVRVYKQIFLALTVYRNQIYPPPLLAEGTGRELEGEEKPKKLLPRSSQNQQETFKPLPKASLAKPVTRLTKKSTTAKRILKIQKNDNKVTQTPSPNPSSLPTPHTLPRTPIPDSLITIPLQVFATDTGDNTKASFNLTVRFKPYYTPTNLTKRGIDNYLLDCPKESFLYYTYYNRPFSCSGDFITTKVNSSGKFKSFATNFYATINPHYFSNVEVKKRLNSPIEYGFGGCKKFAYQNPALNISTGRSCLMTPDLQLMVVLSYQLGKLSSLAVRVYDSHSNTFFLPVEIDLTFIELAAPITYIRASQMGSLFYIQTNQINQGYIFQISLLEKQGGFMYRIRSAFGNNQNDMISKFGFFSAFNQNRVVFSFYKLSQDEPGYVFDYSINIDFEMCFVWARGFTLQEGIIDSELSLQDSYGKSLSTGFQFKSLAANEVMNMSVKTRMRLKNITKIKPFKIPLNQIFNITGHGISLDYPITNNPDLRESLSLTADEQKVAKDFKGSGYVVERICNFKANAENLTVVFFAKEDNLTTVNVTIYTPDGRNFSKQFFNIYKSNRFTLSSGLDEQGKPSSCFLGNFLNKGKTGSQASFYGFNSRTMEGFNGIFQNPEDSLTLIDTGRPEPFFIYANYSQGKELTLQLFYCNFKNFEVGAAKIAGFANNTLTTIFDYVAGYSDGSGVINQSFSWALFVLITPVSNTSSSQNITFSAFRILNSTDRPFERLMVLRNSRFLELFYGLPIRGMKIKAYYNQRNGNQFSLLVDGSDFSFYVFTGSITLSTISSQRVLSFTGIQVHEYYKPTISPYYSYLVTKDFVISSAVSRPLYRYREYYGAKVSNLLVWARRDGQFNGTGYTYRINTMTNINDLHNMIVENYAENSIAVAMTQTQITQINLNNSVYLENRMEHEGMELADFDLTFRGNMWTYSDFVFSGGSYITLGKSGGNNGNNAERVAFLVIGIMLVVIGVSIPILIAFVCCSKLKHNTSDLTKNKIKQIALEKKMNVDAIKNSLL